MESVRRRLATWEWTCTHLTDSPSQIRNWATWQDEMRSMQHGDTGTQVREVFCSPVR